MYEPLRQSEGLKLRMNMKNKIIVAGHLCLDITPIFPNRTASLGNILEPGKLLHMDGVNVHTGGCVANVGLALKKLGADVNLIGKVGDDAFGDIVINILEENKVNGTVVAHGGETSYSVVIAPPGVDRIFLHCSGENDRFYSSDVSDEAFKEAKLFHFGYPPLMMRVSLTVHGSTIGCHFPASKERSTQRLMVVPS